jgi:hypothetical protein
MSRRLESGFCAAPYAELTSIGHSRLLLSRLTIVSAAEALSLRIVVVRANTGRASPNTVCSILTIPNKRLNFADIRNS